MTRTTSFLQFLNKTRFSIGRGRVIESCSHTYSSSRFSSKDTSVLLTLNQINNGTSIVAQNLSSTSVDAQAQSLSHPSTSYLVSIMNGNATDGHLNVRKNPSSNMVDITSPIQIQPPNPNLLEKDEFDDFNAVFPELVKFLTEIPELRDMPETNRWLARVLQYNVPHGKRNRGLAVALAYRYLTDELHEENIKLSYVLGWTVEMLQAFFLVSDDIMDNSQTRRGLPCWYISENLGAAALNDALLLEGAIYQILKRYFGGMDYYVDLLNIMHEASYKTMYGQSLDTRTGLERKMETYTMSRYNGIVKYKTSYYSFHLPVALAMAMAGIKDQELKRQAEKVTLEIGHFFQVQDDYLDCFGDEVTTGKVGTDIQDCKCSWLFVTALQKVNSEQREILLSNYGQEDIEKVAKVKEIYNLIGMNQVYQQFEEDSYNLILTHVQQMSPGLPKRLFVEMLGKIYRRAC